MLLLKVANNERVLIRSSDGEEIWVKVLSTTSKGAMLGIDAPKEVRIMREEVIHKRTPLLEERKP